VVLVVLKALGERWGNAGGSRGGQGYVVGSPDERLGDGCGAFSKSGGM